MEDDKKLHELWWECLKRGKNFRIFCDVLTEYNNPDTAFLGKVSVMQVLIPSPKKLIFNEMLLWMNYKKFGDVFRTNFEDWWLSRKPEKSDKIVEDLEETVEREACAFILHCVKGFKAAEINDDNIIELLQRYMRFYNSEYKFLKIRVSAKDLEIRNAVSSMISKSKKKRTPQLAKLDKYLRTYDMKLKGKSDDEISQDIFYTEGGNFYRKEPENSEPMREKELSETITEYKKHAERLIKNAEQFNFPGDY